MPLLQLALLRGLCTLRLVLLGQRRCWWSESLLGLGFLFPVLCPGPLVSELRVIGILHFELHVQVILEVVQDFLQ